MEPHGGKQWFLVQYGVCKAQWVEKAPVMESLSSPSLLSEFDISIISVKKPLPVALYGELGYTSRPS